MRKCKLNRGEGQIYRELVSLSEEQGHEMGVNLCRTKENSIFAANLCVGKDCEVDIEYDCPRGTKLVGSAHTHPGAYLTHSKVDLEGALRMGENRSCTIAMSGIYLCINDLNKIKGRKRRLTLLERLNSVEKQSRFFTKSERARTETEYDDDMILGKRVVEEWNEILEPLGAHACLSEL